MTFPAPSIILITGIMAAGKSTVAQAVAEKLPKSVHLRGDLFRRLIVNDRDEIAPDASGELSNKALEQLMLRYRIAATAANLYHEAGFAVVYQDIILGPMLNDVVAMLTGSPLFVVVLCPTPDVVAHREETRPKTGYVGWTPEQLDSDLRTNTPRLGLWLDNSTLTVDETVKAIVDRSAEAQITR
jgi:chloramphenicol 3-O-phosphotransferase